MSALIRAATPDEAGAVRDLYTWLFAPPGSTPDTWDPDRAERALRDAISSERSTVLVAEEDGALSAFCTAYIDIDSVRFGVRCWVEDLAVDPSRRSRGTGAAILAAARDWAQEHGATHLELDSASARLDAHRFYEREGGDGGSRAFGWWL